MMNYTSLSNVFLSSLTGLWAYSDSVVYFVSQVSFIVSWTITRGRNMGLPIQFLSPIDILVNTLPLRIFNHLLNE